MVPAIFRQKCAPEKRSQLDERNENITFYWHYSYGVNMLIFYFHHIISEQGNAISSKNVQGNTSNQSFRVDNIMQAMLAPPRVCHGASPDCLLAFFVVTP